jgi:hypothetical protein
MSNLPNSSNVFFDQLFARLWIAHVTRQCNSALALRFDRAFCFFSVALLFFQERKRDVSAFTGEEHSYSTADARVTASNSATFSFSFPAPVYNGASYFGRGFSFASSPGLRWCCGGIGDFGCSTFFTSRLRFVVFAFEPFLLAMS